MKKVEIKLRDVQVTAIEIEPVNWWSMLLLNLAHWHYRLEFKASNNTTLERNFS